MAALAHDDCKVRAVRTREVDCHNSTACRYRNNDQDKSEQGKGSCNGSEELGLAVA
eukprot:CAMPEP_0113829876 /NCGR_PEP_ID=MMETSP0328-20130328/6031_1 /TAXON_ID=39455 /ORGANISM="Alexandrium minutum" /LENGTH=55 /DNA_ID=CAMNT_0000797955 /DNA_START=108 /DNA_END=271 /DNA_ORIENTATION=- /assembly_acc=CAM_ASM_000350